MAGVSYGRRLTELAAERPDEADLVIVRRDGAEQAVTWRELDSRANQIARGLQGLGVGEGDVVALALPTCVEHILVTLAIWKLGATLLPLRHDQPQWEMDRLLDLARPKVAVSDSHRAACPVLSRVGLAATRELPDGPLPDRISEILNLGASSGSTGLPKLILTPIRGVMNDDPQRAGVLEGSQILLVTSPLYHVNGFAYTAPRLLEGSRVFVMEKFDAQLAVELIQKHAITFTVMVPTMLQRIVRLPNVHSDQFTSLQRLLYGGAKIPEWVVDRWLELIPAERFMFAYGSSERLGQVQMTGVDWAERRGSVGVALDVVLSIRDEAGNPLPAGVVGEIYMKPLDPHRRIFEYIGVPTPQPTSDGFRTIGDLGWLDEGGYLYIADRRNDLIISGGANVFPAEVETALSEHPQLLDQVVVGVPDDEWGQRVHAIVQPLDVARPPSREELRTWCRERLAAYKVPKTYEVVDHVPRTEAGKLNRTQLGAQRAERSAG